MVMLTSFTGGYANALPVFTHRITCDRIGSGELTLYPPLFVHLVNHVYNVNLSYIFHYRSPPIILPWH